MLRPHFIHKSALVRSSVVALILSFLCLGADAMQGQDPGVYEAARRAFGEKSFTVAARSFQLAELQPGGETDASLLLAKSLVKLNQFAEAEAALDKYLQRHPEDSDASFLRGYVLFRENRAAPSLEAYTHAATLATPRPDDLKIVALDYVLLQDAASAVRWLRRSVDMNGKDPEAWYFLGRSLFTQSQFIEAERAFTQALELDPTYLRARNNLGLTYEAENRPADALREYQKAVAQDRAARAAHPNAASAVSLEAAEADAVADPGSTASPTPTGETEAQPYLNLGSLMILQNHATDAIPILRDATLLSASCVACHLQLGRALSRTGELPAARAELELAVKLNPADPSLHYELGLLYQRSGDTAAAKVELARSKELYGNHAAGPAVP